MGYVFADFAAPGQRLEIEVRGPGVFKEYWNRPLETEQAFRDGWFRTGDQGVMDGDGYVSITGRLKEIINRGGEKVSPLEVDGVLSAHPDVAQVVTFALPHPKLGEEVAAAAEELPDLLDLPLPELTPPPLPQTETSVELPLPE